MLKTKILTIIQLVVQIQINHKLEELIKVENLQLS
jgi:hypothetical protein